MAARNRANKRAARQAAIAAAQSAGALAWTQENNTAALKDGWSILGGSHPNSRWLRVKPGCFEGRAEMHGFIVQRGLEGSPLYIKLLAYLYAYNKGEFSAVMEARRANETGVLVKKIVAFARVAGAIKGEK